jgi:hypothetical protein
MKLTCRILGHKWKFDSFQNSKIHICARCGITQEHSWESTEKPCCFICAVCGAQEERHNFVKKTDCEKACSGCGKAEISHRWNAVHKDAPSETFWSMEQTRIFDDKLPKNAMGCICERCGKTNPAGVHVCSRSWEGDLFVVRCKHCGTICKAETSNEIEIRRNEGSANEDEGIFR